MAAPLPRRPFSPLPQQLTAPLVRRAQLKPSPSASWVASVRPCSCTALCVTFWWPAPNAPEAFWPQQKVPVPVTAHVWSAPQAMLRAPATPCTGTQLQRVCAVPSFDPVMVVTAGRYKKRNNGRASDALVRRATDIRKV